MAGPASQPARSFPHFGAIPIRPGPGAEFPILARVRTRVLGLVAVTALLAAGALTSARGSSAAGTRLAVLGFQSADATPALIDADAAALTLVGVDGINLIGPGRVSAPDSAVLAQRARARARGLPAVLLVGNWSPRIGDFSELLADRTLRSPSLVGAAARRVAHEALGSGFDGVSVDLESLAPRDRTGLSQFVADLRADLPAGASLTVCLEAFTTLPDYAANGYDLPALAASADQIVLMTYDDHGPWENTPGPIGPLRWQRASLRALERAVPASHVFLGVANYAYAWRPHANDNLTVAQARRLVARWHAQARWVARVGEWTATLGDGSTLWWSDRRSMTVRLRLARTLGVHGVAVWSLGTGDRIPTTGGA
jgi:spore germination protein